MHLAYVFRQTGLIKQVLQVVNVIAFPRGRFRYPPHFMSIFATIRAATYLVIYEKFNDSELLVFLRRAVNKAWAIINSDAASSVYKRLEKFGSMVELGDYGQK